jgi:hypothetical protein
MRVELIDRDRSKDLLRRLIALIDEGFDFQHRRSSGSHPRRSGSLRNRMAEENLFLVFAVEQRTELVGHAELGGHRRASLVAIWMSPDAPEVTFS